MVHDTNVETVMFTDILKPRDPWVHYKVERVDKTEVTTVEE